MADDEDDDDDIEYINHEELVWFAKELGYKSDKMICYGYAGASIPAILLNDVERFNIRLFFMKVIKRVYLDTGHSIRKIIDQISAGNHEDIPKHEQKIITEIPAFCESLEMHYQPEYYPEWYKKGKAPQSQNISKTLKLMLPKKLPGFGYSDIFTGVYTKLEWRDYFKSYLEALDSPKLYHHRHSKLALLLSSVSHSMVVSYDSANKHWTFADVCHTPILEDLSFDQVIDKVDWYLTDNYISIVATQLFGVYPEAVKAVFKCWQNLPQWKSLHQPNENRISRVDWNNANWLHVAAQNGDINTINMLANVHGEKLNTHCNKTTDTGMTPLHFAVQEGFSNVVLILLQIGADPNAGETSTALDYAMDKRDITIIKLLLFYDGVRKNENLLLPYHELYMAKEQLREYLTFKDRLNLPKRMTEFTVDFHTARGKALKKLENDALFDTNKENINQTLMTFEKIESIYRILPNCPRAIPQQEDRLNALSSLVDSAFEMFATASLDENMLAFLEQKAHNVLPKPPSALKNGFFGSNMKKRKNTLSFPINKKLRFQIK